MIKSVSYLFNKTIIVALVFLSLIIIHRDANANPLSVIVKQLDNILNAGKIGRIGVHSYKFYDQNQYECKKNKLCNKKFKKEIKPIPFEKIGD